MSIVKRYANYLKDNEKLVYIGLGVLLALSLITIILAGVCPPAALAFGFGAWSLIGNILPLAAFASLAFYTLVVVIPMAVVGDLSSPAEELVATLTVIRTAMEAFGAIGDTFRANSNSQASSLEDSAPHYPSPLNSQVGKAPQPDSHDSALDSGLVN